MGRVVVVLKYVMVLLTAGLQPACAFAALAGATLVGLAVFHTAAGSLTGGITFPPV